MMNYLKQFMYQNQIHYEHEVGDCTIEPCLFYPCILLLLVSNRNLELFQHNYLHRMQ